MKRASIFMEYAILLGVVSAVLVGMNTYIKRGTQARLKDMTDYFISSEQVSELNPTDSEANTIASANMDEKGYIGGGTRLALLERKNIDSRSRIEDLESPFVNSPFVPSTRGNIIIGNRTDDSAYMDPNWETVVDIEQLTREKEFALNKAERLESSAAQIKSQGMRLIPLVVREPCKETRPHGSAGWTICIKTQVLTQHYEGDMVLPTGIELVENSYYERQKADALRDEAERIQQRIDELKKRLGN